MAERASAAGDAAATDDRQQRLSVVALSIANPNFAWLLLAQSCSSLGGRMVPVTATLLLLNSGSKATAVGAALSVRTIAIVLVALTSGTIIDRLSRRTTLIGASALQGTASISMLLPLSHSSALAGLVLFLVGGGEALFRPVCTAALPSTLGTRDLIVGNSANAVVQRSAGFVGPMIAALGSTIFSPIAAFGVCAGLFFGASFCATRLELKPSKIGQATEGNHFALRSGFRFVLSRPWILAVLLVSGAQLTFAVAPVTVLLPVLSRDVYKTNYLFSGALSAMALGAIAGALITNRVRTDQPGTIGMVGLALYAVPVIFLIVHLPVPILLFSFFVAGIGVEPFSVWWNVALQTMVPAELLGRVLMIDWVLSYALQPVGMALAGPATSSLGVTPVLVGASVLVLTTSCLALLVPGVVQLKDPH